jgi:hypothetical protein
MILFDMTDKYNGTGMPPGGANIDRKEHKTESNPSPEAANIDRKEHRKGSNPVPQERANSDRKRHKIENRGTP